MKKTIVLLVVVFLFSIVSGVYSAEDVEWEKCFDRQFIEDEFERIFHDVFVGMYIANEAEFKEKYIAQKEEFLKRSGIFCGETRILAAQELWENSVIFTDSELKRWHDFVIIWVDISTGAVFKEQNAEEDFTKDKGFLREGIVFWQKEFFINMVITQKSALLINTPKETRLDLLSKTTLERIISELSSETRKNFTIIHEYWRQAFQAMANDIYYATMREIMKETENDLR